jgi:hypothetical protein
MSEIRVDKIVNSSGSGAVEFTQGISIPSGQTLSGIAQTAQGLTATASVNTSGIITATTFVGALTGNVTGNVTGNLNATGVSTAAYLQNTNINSSGIHTASSFSGSLANTLTLATSGTGLSGSTTFNNSGAATFTVTSNATNANTASAIVARDASGNFSAGTITATTFVGALTGNVTGNLTGTASTATLATNAQGLTGTPNITVGDATVTGNLTVQGTTTTLDTVNLVVEDKNIGIGTTTTPSNTTADGGGLTLFGGAGGDKTLTWVNSTAAWTSNQDINLTTGKVYEINGSTVLSSSQVLGKSVPAGTIVGDTDSQTLSSKTLCSSTLTGSLTAGGGTGSNGQFLQSTGAGVCWATAAGGGSGGINVCCVSNFLSCNTNALSISCANNNFLVGCNAGKCTTTGCYNNFLGKYAGCSNTDGSLNNFLGRQAGYYNTIGNHNNFIGDAVGYKNTTGCYNNFLGNNAGFNNTTGNHNNFLGRYSGYNNTTGCFNTFLGFCAGRSNTTGSSNFAIGCFALCSNATGTDNIAIGCFAGRVVAGSCNIFIGRLAGSCTSSSVASNNIAIGALAGRCITTGGSNIALGLYAYRGAGGGCNIVAGHCAGYSATSGNNNIFLGQNAGFNYIGTAGQHQNIFIGCNSGCLVTGGCNVIIGGFIGSLFTACCNHIFLSDGAGNNRLQINNSGALGFAGANYGTAGQVLTSCGNAAAPVWAAAGGSQAMCATGSNTIYSCSAGLCGSENFFAGFQAGPSASAYPQYSTAIGVRAGRYAGSYTYGYNSWYNTFLGYQAGYYRSGGCHNFFAGTCAGMSGFNELASTTGCSNIAIGRLAGVCLTSGNNNVFLGDVAGKYNTTGSYNTFIGYQASNGCVNKGTLGGHRGTNNIALGCNSGNDALYNFGSTDASNIIVIGNNSHTASYVKVAWTTGSDARDKTNIIPIPVGKNFLKQLNPVQYQWADRETGEVTTEKPNYGFLAQDVLALENPPQVIVDDNDPEHLKLRESMIIPVLVKTVQELIEEVDALKEEVRILKGE